MHIVKRMVPRLNFPVDWEIGTLSSLMFNTAESDPTSLRKTSMLETLTRGLLRLYRGLHITSKS